MTGITIASLVIAGLSLVMVIINYATGRHDKGSNQLEMLKESLLKLNMKSDQICSTTNETRTDIKSMDRKLNETITELEVVKRDLQTAFIRIDELKERMNQYEK